MLLKPVSHLNIHIISNFSYFLTENTVQLHYKDKSVASVYGNKLEYGMQLWVGCFYDGCRRWSVLV
jgi:hypothetical protein